MKINVPEGGSVTTDSGAYTCYSGQVCSITVSDTQFDENFIAVPDTGYRFTGWKKRPNGLCDWEPGSCRLWTSGFEGNEGLMSILGSDEVFYLVPTFQVSGGGCIRERSFQFKDIVDADLKKTYVTRELSAGPLCKGRKIGIGNVGEYTAEYSLDGGPWTSAIGDIRAYQKVRVRMESAQTYGTKREALLTIGELECVILITSQCNWILEGGYSEFQITTQPGNPEDAPQVIITYPTDGDTVSGTLLKVKGMATDNHGVQGITVNGVAATSDDDFLTWQATVPLYTGHNEIVVSSADRLLNQNPSAAQIGVFNTHIVIGAARSIYMGNESSNLYVLDMGRGEIVVIDTLTDDWRLVPRGGDTTVPFIDPQRLVVNRAETVAWVLDAGYEDIIEIDLESGAFKLLKSWGYSLVDMEDLGVDEKRNQLLVMAEDSGSNTNSTIRSGRIIAINLETGESKLLSSNGTQGGDAEFFITYWIHMDRVADRLLLFQRNNILSINPKTGQRKLVLEFNALQPRAITVDEPGGRMLVGRAAWNSQVFRLLSVDVASGNYTELPVDSGVIPGNSKFEYDAIRNRLFFTNYGHIGLINLNTWKFKSRKY
jgi:hypothetical protein